MATSNIIFSVIAAAIFLFIIVTYKKWWQEVGLTSALNRHKLRLLWLPAIIILIMLAFAFTSGATTNIIVIALLNTLFVGISEELMFRGILFHGVSSKQNAVWTVIITAILFGSVHALNGFLTGEFGPALLQAIVAIFFGLWIGALRIRLNNIIPLMILHWLWDFSIFTMSQGTVNVIAQIMPLVFPFILLIYGVWLLRGYNPDETAVATQK